MVLRCREDFLRKSRNKTWEKGYVRKVSNVMLTVFHVYQLPDILPDFLTTATQQNPLGGRDKDKMPHPQTL